MNHDVTHFPEPEILSREDTEHGRWTVEGCAPKRGLPHTIIVDRKMVTPVDDSDMSRVIRAHEMMHAKCSPGAEFVKWVEREIASEDALRAVEELRVNLLCQKAGFDMKGSLSDDGETADGERAAVLRDWRGAVLMSINCVGTASHKKFLTGVRRHDRFWGKCLLDISKRAQKFMERAYRQGGLADTSIDSVSGMAPKGFAHTERIAEWIDRIAEQAPPEPEPDVEEVEDDEDATGTGTTTTVTTDEDEGKGDDDKKNDDRQRSHSNISTGKAREGFGDRLRKITPDRREYGVPCWGELEIEKLPLVTLVPGTVGKKRIPAQTGRNPRRLHRILTDPEMRIFDRTIKGMGGVLVLDASGSMDFTHLEIRKILEAAPGITVLAYSDCGDGPNAWILADKGRMVGDLPSMGSGNGVDLPAIEWGVKHKQRPNSPVIWVSDGGVCGPHQGFSSALALQCIRYCIKNNIVVVPHLDDALKQLKRMRGRQKGRTTWPRQLCYVYHDAMGSKIGDDYPGSDMEHYNYS
jgi:hypothetical protein